MQKDTRLLSERKQYTESDPFRSAAFRETNYPLSFILKRMENDANLKTYLNQLPDLVKRGVVAVEIVDGEVVGEAKGATRNIFQELKASTEQLQKRSFLKKARGIRQILEVKKDDLETFRDYYQHLSSRH